MSDAKGLEGENSPPSGFFISRLLLFWRRIRRRNHQKFERGTHMRKEVVFLAMMPITIASMLGWAQGNQSHLLALLEPTLENCERKLRTSKGAPEGPAARRHGHLDFEKRAQRNSKWLTKNFHQVVGFKENRE